MKAHITEAPFEELLARWQHLVWWSSIEPVAQRMLAIDLTLAELVTLRRSQYQPLTIADVAARLALSHSAASRTVDRLVGAGLLQRRENPADRRQKQISLTAEGAALIREIEDLVTDRLRPLLLQLDAADRARLTALMSTLLPDHADQQGEPCPAWRAPREMEADLVSVF